MIHMNIGNDDDDNHDDECNKRVYGLRDKIENMIEIIDYYWVMVKLDKYTKRIDTHEENDQKTNSQIEQCIYLYL